MKKILLLVAIAGALGFASCEKSTTTDPEPDPVEKITVPLSKMVTLVEFSAAWCGPCGAWGNDAFHKGINDNVGSVVAFSVHGSSGQPDGMTSKHNDILKNNWPISGWPNFHVANSLTVSSGNLNNEIGNAKAKAIDAQVGYKVTEEADEYKIEARVEFFEDVSGDYYVAFYALENSIPGGDGEASATNGLGNSGRMDQAGDNSAGYVHDHVFRAASEDGPWGAQIINGSVTAGDDFELSAVIKKENIWFDVNKIEIVAVIYKKVGSSGPLAYEYVNANNEHE